MRLCLHLILAVSLILPARAFPADEPACPTFFQRVGKGVRRYIDEVKETRGVRLLFKDGRPIKERWYGFWQVEPPPPPLGFFGWVAHKTGRVVQWVPNRISERMFPEQLPYDLKVGGWFEKFVRQTTQHAEKAKAVEAKVKRELREYKQKHTKGKGKERETRYPEAFPTRKRLEAHLRKKAWQEVPTQKGKDPTLFWLLPMGVASWIGYGYFDDWFKEKLGEKTEHLVEEAAEEWDAILAGDYRFRDVQEDLAAAKITPKDARERAFLRQKMIGLYFHFTEQTLPSMSPEDRRAALLGFPAYAHIAVVQEQGVPRKTGFIYGSDFKKEVSLEQVDDLIAINHHLITMDQVIPAMVKNPVEAKEMLEMPDVQEKITTLKKDPFVQFLYRLKDEGKLSDDQLVYRIQEDLHWRTKFIEYGILKVVKLKVEDDGSPSSSPLSLEDIRSETIDEIRESAKLP